MNEIGHNIPPGMIEVCDQVSSDINVWLGEHPAILTEEEARQAKLHLDRGKLGLKDLDDERDGKVRPLNEKVKAINESYRPTKSTLGALLQEIGKRIETYIRAEETKRVAAAKEAARRAAEAESLARAAERAEQEVLDARNTGELGVNIATAVATADTAFRQYEKAERAAQIAEKETHVKVGGGFSRATSLRSVPTYHIIDIREAIEVFWMDEGVREAILKAARAYYKVFGEAPPGIEVITERKI